MRTMPRVVAFGCACFLAGSLSPAVFTQASQPNDAEFEGQLQEFIEIVRETARGQRTEGADRNAIEGVVQWAYRLSDGDVISLCVLGLTFLTFLRR